MNFQALCMNSLTGAVTLGYYLVTHTFDIVGPTKKT